MNYAPSILVLIFLAITFIMSSYDKIFHWQENITWLKSHFEETIIKNIVPLSVAFLLIIELIAGIFSIAGCIQLIVNGGRTYGLYGAIFSCVSLLVMLIGQRLAKDYDGARTIVIYFIPALIGVFLLS